ncbi:MAG: thioredoxin domain-containing protein, partial [Gammaproteobacteria bacterium]|nr:thioredoxin domain-containing protein [Gammaproteobacteria bacterium]
CSLLNALDDYLEPPELIILRGDAGETSVWAATLGTAYNPRRIVFSIPRDAENLPVGLASKAATGDGVRAYVCRGTVCGPPLNSLEALTKL